MKKIKVGVVGAGIYGLHHINTIYLMIQILKKLYSAI